MERNTFEELKHYINIYRQTEDNCALSKIIDLHDEDINAYILKCTYEELDKDEITDIIITNIIEIAKYYNLDKGYEAYQKNLKDTIKKKVYNEVKKIRNNNDSYEDYEKIETLTEKEQFILNSTKGLNGYEKLPIKDIAESLNISCERVKVLERKIRKKLNHQEKTE